MKAISNVYQWIKDYPAYDNAIVLFLFLFFLTPLIVLFTGVSISTPLFLIVLLAVLFGYLAKGFPRKGLIVVVLFGVSILPGIAIAFINDIPLKHIILALTYYLKIPAFFTFFYYYVSEKHFTRLVWLVLWGMLAAFPLYALTPGEFIDASRERLRALGYFVSDSIYFSGTKLTEWITFPRNPGFLLSYLDSAYVLYFVTTFFIVTTRTVKEALQRLWIIALSGFLFLSTFTRSTLIALPVSAVSWAYFGLLKGKQRLYLLLFVAAVALIGIILFFDTLYFLVVTQASAIVHWENIGDSLLRIAQYPFGTGFGTSGWQGFSQSPLYMYAEGSLFTGMIEMGFFYFIWQAIVGVFFFFMSRKVLFSLYLGFFVVSILLPIGFSTFFTLLMFGYAGVIYYQQQHG